MNSWNIVVSVAINFTLSPQMLWVGFPYMGMCIWTTYVIFSLSMTLDRSFVVSNISVSSTIIY